MPQPRPAQAFPMRDSFGHLWVPGTTGAPTAWWHPVQCMGMCPATPSPLGVKTLLPLHFLLPVHPPLAQGPVLACCCPVLCPQKKGLRPVSGELGSWRRARGCAPAWAGRRGACGFLVCSGDPGCFPRRQLVVPRPQPLGRSQTAAGQPGSTARQPSWAPPGPGAGWSGRGPV